MLLSTSPIPDASRAFSFTDWCPCWLRLLLASAVSSLLLIGTSFDPVPPCSGASLDWCLPTSESRAAFAEELRRLVGSRTVCAPQLLAALNRFLGDPLGFVRSARPGTCDMLESAPTPCESAGYIELVSHWFNATDTDRAQVHPGGRMEPKFFALPLRWCMDVEEAVKVLGMFDNCG